ncbi:MAG: hypothetical protein JWR33_1428 [Naasia sp.]|nr:hypothetical protein [Naasia sp.]
MRARLRQDQDPLHLVPMLVLSFSTRVVDAVDYLGLDRVFTGNMTGNVVIPGMALTGADCLPIVGPIVALHGFVAGAIGADAALLQLALGGGIALAAGIPLAVAAIGHLGSPPRSA